MTVREALSVHDKLEAERKNLANAMKGANSMKQLAEDKYKEALKVKHKAAVTGYTATMIIGCILAAILIIKILSN